MFKSVCILCYSNIIYDSAEFVILMNNLIAILRRFEKVLKDILKNEKMTGDLKPQFIKALKYHYDVSDDGQRWNYIYINIFYMKLGVISCFTLALNYYFNTFCLYTLKYSQYLVC